MALKEVVEKYEVLWPMAFSPLAESRYSGRDGEIETHVAGIHGDTSRDIDLHLGAITKMYFSKPREIPETKCMPAPLQSAPTATESAELFPMREIATSL